MITINTAVTYLTEKDLKYGAIEKGIDKITLDDVPTVIAEESQMIILTLYTESGRYKRKILKSRY